MELCPGINYANYKVTHLTNVANIHNTKSFIFDKQLSFRMGVLLEFVSPYRGRKWSIIVEPGFQYYKGEKELSKTIVSVDFKSLELPLGIRY